jgi:hypothetical protein
MAFCVCTFRRPGGALSGLLPLLSRFLVRIIFMAASISSRAALIARYANIAAGSIKTRVRICFRALGQSVKL